MTSPCLSLSNEPIFSFLEDKAAFDSEEYRRKFSIIGTGQLESRGRKRQRCSDTMPRKKWFPGALLHSFQFLKCPEQVPRDAMILWWEFTNFIAKGNGSPRGGGRRKEVSLLSCPGKKQRNLNNSKCLKGNCHISSSLHRCFSLGYCWVAGSIYIRDTSSQASPSWSRM